MHSYLLSFIPKCPDKRWVYTESLLHYDLLSEGHGYPRHRGVARCIAILSCRDRGGSLPSCIEFVHVCLGRGYSTSRIVSRRRRLLRSGHRPRPNGGSYIVTRLSGHNEGATRMMGARFNRRSRPLIEDQRHNRATDKC